MIAAMIAAGACSEHPVPRSATSEGERETANRTADEPDSGARVADRDASAHAVGLASDSGPDAGGCRGQASTALVEALQARAAESRVCYERALRDNPKLAGRVAVTVRILDDGVVDSVKLDQDEIGSNAVRICLKEIFVRAFSVRPDGGCIVATVPIGFKPKAAGDGGA